ncbi:MAG: hypothetical protein J0I18_06060 [Actinobacteria bacterium]|nr:hypothetical protein [Actinomycetota bacterium]
MRYGRRIDAGTRIDCHDRLAAALILLSLVVIDNFIAGRGGLADARASQLTMGESVLESRPNGYSCAPLRRWPDRADWGTVMPIRAVNWPATRRPPADSLDDAQPLEVGGTKMPISLMPVRATSATTMAKLRLRLYPLGRRP